MGAYLNKYFYEDGSCSAGFASFIKNMIIPFKNAVKTLMESVINGELQNPVSALTEKNERLKKEKAEEKIEKEKEKELLKKSYGENVRILKEILLPYKEKTNNLKLKEEDKNEIIYLLSRMVSAAEKGNKEDLEFALITFKYLTKCRKLLFFGKAKKISKIIREIINAI